jgi:predicted aspartyl protease
VLPRAEPKAAAPSVVVAPPPPPKLVPQPQPPPVVLPERKVLVMPPAAPAPVPTPAPPVVIARPLAPAPKALKQFRVPYKAFEGTAGRIIIPVTFNGGVTAPMALDTGAPGIIISFRVAERIGVLREGDARLVTMAGGIGGSQTAAMVILDDISVGEARSEFVPVTVTQSISGAFEGLVGMDFIAGYRLEIDTREHTLMLNELPPSAEAPGGHDEAWWRHQYAIFSGQRALWKNVFAVAQERVANNEVSAGGSSENLKQLMVYAESQNREAESLAGRLEQYAALLSVPLEWRRQQ